MNWIKIQPEKMKNLIQITSIISYCSIILMGQMIALPFILWLILTVFDFGNIDQLLAILGVIGITLNFTKWKNKISVAIMSLILMLSPIIGRLMQAPIEMFDYLGFKVPLIVFILTYIIFIIMNIVERKKII